MQIDESTGAGQRIPFAREDEQRIASAATWGQIVGATSIASAIIGTIVSLATQGARGLLGEFIGLVISVILGTWLLQAGTAFRKVALTDEADEHYLLLGFSKLRAYFMMSGILAFIALGFVALGLLAALTCGSMLMR
jgi:hypothetical protein